MEPPAGSKPLAITISPLIALQEYIETLQAHTVVVVADPKLLTISVTPEPHPISLIARLSTIKLVLVESFSEFETFLRHNAFAPSDLVPLEAKSVVFHGVFAATVHSCEGSHFSGFVDETDCNARTMSRCLHWMYNMAYYRNIAVTVYDEGALTVAGGSEDSEQEEDSEEEELGEIVTAKVPLLLLFAQWGLHV